LKEWSKAMEEWNDGMLEYWVIFYKNFQLITIIPLFQYSNIPKIGLY